MAPWTPNRSASAEAQCGTALRAARDLTGEPCSPVSPFFLDRELWLGEGASRELGGGVGGAFHASGGAEGILTPDDFSLVPPGGTISFSKKEMVGPTVPRLEGGFPRPAARGRTPPSPPVAEILRPAPCAESLLGARNLFPAGNHAPPPRGNPAFQWYGEANPSVGFAASPLYTRGP